MLLWSAAIKRREINRHVYSEINVERSPSSEHLFPSFLEGPSICSQHSTMWLVAVNRGFWLSVKPTQCDQSSSQPKKDIDFSIGDHFIIKISAERYEKVIVPTLLQ